MCVGGGCVCVCVGCVCREGVSCVQIVDVV